MSNVSFVMVMINFILIASLPFIIFRRDGSFNLRWCITALPFLVAVLVLIFGFVEVLTSLSVSSLKLFELTQISAAILSIASIGLIASTIHVHKFKPALWHQVNDQPQELVTWGPYKNIRHPFYSAFILAFCASLCLFPHYLLLGCFVYSSLVLTFTAKREETRLTQVFGRQYQCYMSTTGRFIPKRLL
ncbi:isoprenylcysteine carboxylmethyltransferase family protein [Thalassotalea psychrophila]|uniref:Isoprenylcysteine carboxylmethyltransferase family protein n=1 Tax=Thalassotalea psychrophila TaxID=3065647 RepID=A0ABY9TYM2_9GAMM|nr:isoprenylcysteine carboxylmethyltransferase family protein [Colwelliaceae bacterium SQ149]